MVSSASFWGTERQTRQFGIPLVVDAQVLLLPMAFSVAIGVVFGFLPARQAARLRPIEALRHESLHCLRPLLAGNVFVGCG